MHSGEQATPAHTGLGDLPPWGYAAIGLCASALNDGIAFGILYSRGMLDQLFTLPKTHGSLLAAAHVAEEFVVLPAIWAFYGWMRRAPQSVLRDLDRRGVLDRGSEDGEYLGFTTGAWSIIYLAGVVFALLGARVMLMNPPGWNQSSRLFAQLIVPMTFVLWLMVWGILWTIVDAVVVFGKTFGRRALSFRPFHPDRVGGLGPLKRYAQTLVSFLAVVGAGLLIDTAQGLLTGTFARDAILQIYLVSYAILVPVCFLASLWPAHAAMTRERDKILLSSIPSSFDEWQNASFRPLTDADSIKGQLDNMKTMRELRGIVMRFPVWPFDSGSVRHVAAAALGPSIIAQLLQFVPALAHSPLSHQ